MDSKLLIFFIIILLLTHINEIFSQTLIDSKIIGGTVARIANERHFASIRLKSKEEKNGFGSGHFCGGSLIRDNIIVTAAHCLFRKRLIFMFPIDPSELIVVMGSIPRKIQQSKTVIRSVERIIRHPDFNFNNTKNDIGLILLNKTGVVPENPNTAVIQLSEASPVVDTECRISGFGHEAYVRKVGDEKVSFLIVTFS